MAEATPAKNDGRPLHCVIVTPEETLLETEATFVALPLFDGESGIAPLHSPMIGRLGYGEMRVTDRQGATRRFYVDGGFVQVVENRLAVLTGRAMPAEAVDAEEAAERLAAARSRTAHGDEEIAARQKLVDQARAQLRVARHAGADHA